MWLQFQIFAHVSDFLFLIYHLFSWRTRLLRNLTFVKTAEAEGSNGTTFKARESTTTDKVKAERRRCKQGTSISM